VRVEELSDERLEDPDRLRGGERQAGPPAVDHHRAVAAVDRGDETLGADRSVQLLRHPDVDAVLAEERRSGDDLGRAHGEHGLRPL
jgi:hypothetical protein